MGPRGRPGVTSWFGRGLRHSSVPGNFRIADAGNAGSGRPSGRCVCTSSWTGESMAAWWLKAGAVAAAATVVTLTSRASASALPARIGSANARSEAVDRWSSLLAEAALHTGLPAVWLHDLLGAESNGKPAGRVVQGRHRADAVDARDLHDAASSTWSRHRSVRPARQHPGRRDVPAAACRPLRLARRARCLQRRPSTPGRVSWRTDERCLQRRSRTSGDSRRSTPKVSAAAVRCDLQRHPGRRSMHGPTHGQRDRPRRCSLRWRARHPPRRRAPRRPSRTAGRRLQAGARAASLRKISGSQVRP